MTTRISLAVVALAACGSSSNTKADSPAGATVQAVSCPPAPAAEITTNSGGTAYMPNTASIPAGGVVRFIMPSAHNVTSTSGGLAVTFGETKCLMFTAPGTYNFKCSVHGFTGSVTVQ